MHISVYKFIVQLLKPNGKIEKKYFSSKQAFWDKLIMVGSTNLLLPAIYSSFIEKKLDKDLPEELNTFLEKIYELNKHRNNLIFKQIKKIGDCFNQNNIEYVFLKGAAILLHKPYNALNKRMIGDIDILVVENDLLRAQQILKKNGYENVKSELAFFEDLLIKNARHLNRISHKDFISAVEIHRYLLDYNKIHLLKSNEILKEKIKTSEGYWTPSKFHMWKHAILNLQYNDQGLLFNYINLKSFLDIFHLEPNDIKSNLKSFHPSIRNYYNLLSLHDSEYSLGSNFKKLHYHFQIRYLIFSKLNKFSCKIYSLTSIVFSRFLLVFNSRAYRNKLFGNLHLIKQKIINYWRY